MQPEEKALKIGELSEKQLRKEVLIPLLSSMGFKGVREYHGARERGKDIICYSLNNLGNREYMAVVVKVTKIHGSVGKEGSVANMVYTQVQQALNEPYVDVYDIKELTADRCLVITSNEIVSACIEDILGTLKSQQLDRILNFADREWLIQKIDEFMPTYFEERDKSEIIGEKEQNISELKEKQRKAVQLIYDVGKEYGVPKYITDSSATPVLSTSSEFDFNATVFSGTTATFDPYIPRSQILTRFLSEGIIEPTVRCPHCGAENQIDPGRPFMTCTNCYRDIY